jgi:hypothetical protein
VDLPPRLRLAFDLAYGESESQLKSLGRQLSMVYGLMRKTAMGEDGPLPSVHLTSATPEVRHQSTSSSRYMTPEGSVCKKALVTMWQYRQ